MCCLLLTGRATAIGACRDCAQPGFGGPAENRFTAYDALCRGDVCREAGYPQAFVNASNLTLFVRVNDLVFGGPAPAFAIERSYNSDDTHAGVFGIGWSSNLGESLTADSTGTLALRRGSGRIDRFAPAAGSSAYFAVTSTADSLTKNADGTFTLTARTANGSRVFSADGRLLSMGGVSLDYDAAGRATAAHIRGRPLKIAYDGAGRITSVSDATGRTVSYSYTDEGRLASTTNADGRATTYRYDGNGLLAAIGFAGGTTAIAYASDGPPYSSVASVTAPDGAVRQYDIPRTPTEIRATDANGDSTLYVSNASGQLVSMSNSAGMATYSYDAAGRRTRAVNGAGEATAFTYDAGDNLTGITDATGNRWTAAYGPSGITQITDPRGNVWQFRYDAAGALAGVTDPMSGAVTATRSAAGQIDSITDARGNKLSYTYNADGLLTGFTDALGGAWSYQYDGAARPSARTDPGGGTLAAEYTSANRIAAVSAGDQRTAFDYSGAQRDGLGRLTSYTDTFGSQIAYSYDGAGRLASMTLPGGNAVSYTYDHAGRLSKVADWAGNFALYRYDAAGYPASVTVSGGPIAIYQYDAARRLRAIVSTGPDGTTVAGYRYTFDAGGNRTSVTALEPLDAAPAISGNSMTVDAANHPAGRGDGENYKYDARGNLVSIAGSRNVTFGYDAFGRLQSVNGDAQTTYGYDTQGLRTVRTTAGAERRFVYDLSGPHPRVVMETDNSNAPVAYYVYGLGLLWKLTADGTPYFYHFDGDGNVVAVSNPSSGVVNKYRYDPLGRLAGSNETVENGLRAHGEAGWIDDGNGLVFDGAAYRFPDLGLTLPGAADPSPPAPDLLPQLPGAGTCFVEGAASCGAASNSGATLRNRAATARERLSTRGDR